MHAALADHLNALVGDKAAPLHHSCHARHVAGNGCKAADGIILRPVGKECSCKDVLLVTRGKVRTHAIRRTLFQTLGSKLSTLTCVWGLYRRKDRV